MADFDLSNSRFVYLTVICFSMIFVQAIPVDLKNLPESLEISSQNVTAHICPSLCLNGDEATCAPPSCPFPPCVDRKRIRPLDCCAICPNGLCLVGNMTSCVPPPCPFPPCVDHTKIRPLDCCEVCPNGPNCQGPDGVIIKYDHWQIIDGKNCSCTQPPSTATCV